MNSIIDKSEKLVKENRKLEAKILAFRQKIVNYEYGIDCIVTRDFMKKFDEWFNITTERHGKSNNVGN